MDLTITLADRFKVTPFDIFRENCDDVIQLINFFIQKGEDDDTEGGNVQSADDGFWDT